MIRTMWRQGDQEELLCELSPGDSPDDMESRGEDPQCEQLPGVDGSLVDKVEAEDEERPC